MAWETQRKMRLSGGGNESPQQDAFGFVHAFPTGGADLVAAFARRLPELLSHQRGVNAELLRCIGGELVAHDAIGHAPDMRQQVVEGFALALGRPREKLHRAVNQVVGVALGSFDSGYVLLDAALANKAVGIEARFKGDDFNLKILFGEQGDRLLGGVRAGGIGVEVNEQPLGVSAEQTGPASR